MYTPRDLDYLRGQTKAFEHGTEPFEKIPRHRRLTYQVLSRDQAMADEETFQVRVHGEQEVRTLTVKTGKYQLAVAAAPAIFGLDLPVDIEIWCERLLPDYGPYHYRVHWNEFVCVAVQHLLPTRS